MKKQIVTGTLICLALCFCGALSESMLDSIEKAAEESKLAIMCAALSTSCDECVANSKCLWCNSHLIKCIPYPADDVIPSSDVCPLTDARWGVCWVNYLILLIVMGCIAALILISIILCVWCCCCKGK